MSYLSPYLIFSGNCKEAMEFYKQALGAELELQIVGESPMASNSPAEAQNQVMHSKLSKNGNTLFMASDMMMNGTVTQGNNVNLCYIGDLEDIKTAFVNLSTGGNVTHELKEEFFGTYGDLVDKYGIRWMFQSDSKAQA